ncbi:MAG TPA: hypothetical protein VLS49_07305 [Usitatibacter sp.]|nr:hypothetical protein [Usitatibacter sp.]
MHRAAFSAKSTNVRVQWSDSTLVPAVEERPAAALALALGLWGAAVAVAAADGVFARLGTGLDLALAAFAALFAAGTYALDERVRERIDATRPRVVAAVALGGDAALAACMIAAGPASLAQGPLALVAFFAAPLALAAHLPLARALRSRRLRRGSGRSPGARPAAT